MRPRAPGPAPACDPGPAPARPAPQGAVRPRASGPFTRRASVRGPSASAVTPPVTLRVRTEGGHHRPPPWRWPHRTGVHPAPTAPGRYPEDRYPCRSERPYNVRWRQRGRAAGAGPEVSGIRTLSDPEKLHLFYLAHDHDEQPHPCDRGDQRARCSLYVSNARHLRAPACVSRPEARPSRAVRAPADRATPRTSRPGHRRAPRAETDRPTVPVRPLRTNAPCPADTAPRTRQ